MSVSLRGSAGLRAGRGKCQLNLPSPQGYRQGEGQVWPAVTCDTWSEFLSTWGTAGQVGVKAHFIAEEEEQAW